jgi:hypothetical protein
MAHIAFRTDSTNPTAEFVRAGLLRSTRTKGMDDAALQFATIDRVCNRFGGLVSGDTMAMAMRKFRDQPISTLARWIVDRTVISLDWHGHVMLPMFQFDPFDMSPRSDVHDIAQALAATHADWDIALWFAQPNALLDGEIPIDVIEHDFAAVMQAARSAASVAMTRLPT